MKTVILISLLFICLKGKAQDSTKYLSDSSYFISFRDSTFKSNYAQFYIDTSWAKPSTTYSWYFTNGKKEYEIIFETKDMEKMARYLSSFFNKRGIRNKLKIK